MTFASKTCPTCGEKVELAFGTGDGVTCGSCKREYVQKETAAGRIVGALLLGGFLLVAYLLLAPVADGTRSLLQWLGMIAPIALVAALLNGVVSAYTSALQPTERSDGRETVE